MFFVLVLYFGFIMSELLMFLSERKMQKKLNEEFIKFQEHLKQNGITEKELKSKLEELGGGINLK
jgi:hypothetical protein